MLLTIAAAALAGLSFALTLWQWFVARRFPLHQPSLTSPPLPAITLFKPLKGCDAETEGCLRSWLEQSYAGPIQILFGVAAPEDPVCALVQKLIAAHPNCDAELIICPEPLGPNGKVSTLAQLHGHARHDLLVISDADVSAPAGLLASLAALLADSRIGLVNCLYKLGNPANAAMQWEAIAINADFWSQVLQARTLKPMDFALGAVMATRRGRLKAIGGFTALLDYLADDYQLGQLIARGGAAIELCPLVVECRSGPMGWTDVWRHQLRWARTIRACQPLPFFFSILSNATLWPLLWVALDPAALPAVGASLFLTVRLVSARSNYRRLTGQSLAFGMSWLVLAKDFLGAAIWLLAFTGQTVEWRGQRYRILPGGRLALR